MAGTAVIGRCEACGARLAFEAWSEGQRRCRLCEDLSASPAATFVRGPVVPPGRIVHRGRPKPPPDPLPDELLDELVAALEAEAAAGAGEPRGALQELLEELRPGSSARELQWSAWGFAGGFGANLLVAKYAQMTTGAPTSEILAPLLVGGLVAGFACAAIGWGLAKLREG